VQSERPEPVAGQHVGLHERAGVQQQLEALARGQLAARVLSLDGLCAAAQARLLLEVPELVDPLPGRGPVRGGLRLLPLGTGLRLGGVLRVGLARLVALTVLFGVRHGPRVYPSASGDRCQPGLSVARSTIAARWT